MADLWFEFSSYISGLKGPTLMTIVTLVAFAGFILKQIVESGYLATMFVACFQAGAFVLNFVFAKFNLTLFATPDLNLIAISTLGMVIGLIVMITLMRTGMAIADATQTTVQRPENRPGVPTSAQRR